MILFPPHQPVTLSRLLSGRLSGPLSCLLPCLSACLLLAGAPTAGQCADAAQRPAHHRPVKPAVKQTVKKTVKPAVKPASVARTDYLGEAVGFGQWQAVAAFEDEMVARHGYRRAELDALMAQVRFVDAAVQLVKPAPPGKPKNWQAYRALIVDQVRTDAGVRFWNDNAAVLARVEARYGVPAEIIVGIIGVETVYGRNTGRFRVMDVLTTLAFAYPDTPNREARMAFFRAELENTLLLARRNAIDPLSLLGSFAGAIGLPQFMPGSILAYGVDVDGDGSIDLRNSQADAIGSVANFLVRHGWRAERRAPFVYAVDVSPARAWEGLLERGLEATLRADELPAAGVAPATALPADTLFGLIDLQNGAQASDYWLATDNFFAITRYNRSYFYAMSVIELGNAVHVARERLKIIPKETL